MKVLMVSKALVVGAYHKKLGELSALGVDLHLIAPEEWNGLDLEVRTGEGYSIYPHKVFFPGRNHFHCYRGISDLIASLKPEIVHIDEEHYSIVTWQLMRLAKKAGARSLFFTWQNIHKKYPFPFSAIENYVFGNATAAIAGNREAGEVLRKKGFKKDIFEIPQFGVDPEIFKKADAVELRRSLNIPEGDFVIGYMGRLVEEKGIGLLFESLTKLPAAARLLLIGGGPEKENLHEAACRLGVNDRIVTVDQVPSLEVPRYMNCMDCLVLPSLTRPNWKEQFGRVLIEAMACEVPVVGSSSGEIPNVIGDAGLVFPEGQSDDLSRHLEMLMKDRVLRTELGKQGRQRVLANFTQKKIAEATYEVYKRILKV